MINPDFIQVMVSEESRDISGSYIFALYDMHTGKVTRPGPGGRANCIIPEPPNGLLEIGEAFEIQIKGKSYLTLGDEAVEAGSFLCSDEEGKPRRAIPGKDFPLVQALSSGEARILIPVRWC